MAQDTRPCARCKVAPRNSGSHKSYCRDCKNQMTAASAAKSRAVLDTRPCARCKKAPRNSSLRSYCVDCKRALERESKERRGRWKNPLTNCSRCGGKRTGSHPNYCVACHKAYREERRAEACGRCGRKRDEGDRTSTSYCYDCYRNRWVFRKYGLTGEQYDQMLADQGQRCALCHDENNGRTWHVDHCHASNRVRGLLCDLCNRGLGHFRDDPAVLRRAAEYLEAHASA